MTQLVQYVLSYIICNMQYVPSYYVAQLASQLPSYVRKYVVCTRSICTKVFYFRKYESNNMYVRSYEGKLLLSKVLKYESTSVLYVRKYFRKYFRVQLYTCTVCVLHSERRFFRKYSNRCTAVHARYCTCTRMSISVRLQVHVLYISTMALSNLRRSFEDRVHVRVLYNVVHTVEYFRTKVRKYFRTFVRK